MRTTAPPFESAGCARNITGRRWKERSGFPFRFEMASQNVSIDRLHKLSHVVRSDAVAASADHIALLHLTVEGRQGNDGCDIEFLVAPYMVEIQTSMVAFVAAVRAAQLQFSFSHDLLCLEAIQGAAHASQIWVCFCLAASCRATGVVSLSGFSIGSASASARAILRSPTPNEWRVTDDTESLSSTLTSHSLSSLAISDRERHKR